MTKPKIVKITHRRNIGVSTKQGYYIDEHQGLDDNGNQWTWIAYIDVISGKVVSTHDYRRA